MRVTAPRPRATASPLRAAEPAPELAEYELGPVLGAGGGGGRHRPQEPRAASGPGARLLLRARL